MAGSLAFDLLDGGSGMEFKKRKSAGRNVAYNLTLFSTAALRETPDAVRELHRDWIRSGCTVITTASYAVTTFYLNKVGEGHRVQELAELSVRLAKQAVADEGAEGRVKIAACVPPLGQSYNAAECSEEALLDEYRQLVHALRGGDLFLIETMATLAEARAAARACHEVAPEVPVWLSFHPRRSENGGRACVSADSSSIEEAVAASLQCGAQALLFNCATPQVVAMALAEAKSAAQGKLRLGAYANFWEEHDARKWSIDMNETDHGRGDAKEGGFVVRQDLTDEMYTCDASAWMKLGASIVGGCCGIGPSTIRYVGESLGVGFCPYGKRARTLRSQ